MMHCADDIEISVSLSPDDMSRLEEAAEKMQHMVQDVMPDMTVDDCVDAIFSMGLALAESPHGLLLALFHAVMASTREARP